MSDPISHPRRRRPRWPTEQFRWRARPRTTPARPFPGAVVLPADRTDADPGRPARLLCRGQVRHGDRRRPGRARRRTTSSSSRSTAGTTSSTSRRACCCCSAPPGTRSRRPCYRLRRHLRRRERHRPHRRRGRPRPDPDRPGGQRAAHRARCRRALRRPSARRATGSTPVARDHRGTGPAQRRGASGTTTR